MEGACGKRTATDGANDEHDEQEGQEAEWLQVPLSCCGEPIASETHDFAWNEI